MGRTAANGAARGRDAAALRGPGRTETRHAHWRRALSGGGAPGVSEPLLLAMDTSTSTASLALFDGTQVLSETTWLAGREHSTRLLIEVQIALERIGREPTDLTGLVVARGPGS